MAIKKALKPIKEHADAVIGIITTNPIHKTAYLLNRAFHLDLKCHNDLLIYAEKLEQDVPIEFYMYRDEMLRTYFILIKNTVPFEYLTPAVRIFDYFLILKGVISDNVIKELLRNIKGTTGISEVMMINQKAIKSLMDLNEYIELHLDSINYQSH